MTHPTLIRRCTPLAAGLAVAVAVTAATGSLAQGGPAQQTLTLRELGKGATFTHIRNTKRAPRRSNLQGDVLAFTNPLTRDGKRVGRLEASCVTTSGAKNFTRSRANCTAVTVLADGTLHGTFLLDLDNERTAGAITGGTGAYAGARGTIANERDVDTITYSTP